MNEKNNTYTMTDSEREEAEQIAAYLAKNYLNAVWDMHSGKSYTVRDIYNIQGKYDEVKLEMVEKYEKNLNDKVLKFFKLRKKKKKENITFNNVVDILKYKLWEKPKRKFACYMWDVQYDIYHLVRRD